MIEEFECWVLGNFPIGKDCIFRSPTDIPTQSIYIDLENDTYLKRITLWDTLACHSESVNIATEEFSNNHYTIKDIETLKEIFVELYNL